MAKRTCLYDAHVALKGKLVDFAGFDMPIQYEGILQEHEATRQAVGLFDVSHMGKFYLEGDSVTHLINTLVTNDISDMSNGQALYSPMCYEDGGTVDDILIYKFEDDAYMLVVNASNKDKDYEWIQRHLEASDVSILDDTVNMCQLALQGPKAMDLLNSLVKFDLETIPYYWFQSDIDLAGVNVLISRTGYTGEDGFELYFSSDYAIQLWDYLLEKGQAYGIKPCGLGARDTLRFEAGMPLYGNELSESLNPIEAGLSYFVKLDKESFIGKESLTLYKSNKKRKIVGFKLLDRGIARHGSQVVDDDGNVIGSVTTGYKSPTFGDTLGFALIPADYNKDTLTLQIRKKRIEAKIIGKRFLKTYTTEV